MFNVESAGNNVKKIEIPYNPAHAEPPFGRLRPHGLPCPWQIYLCSEAGNTSSHKRPLCVHQASGRDSALGSSPWGVQSSRSGGPRWVGQAETQQNPARSWNGGDGVRATPWQSGDTAGNNAGALAGQTVARLQGPVCPCTCVIPGGGRSLPTHCHLSKLSKLVIMFFVFLNFQVTVIIIFGRLHPQKV